MSLGFSASGGGSGSGVSSTTSFFTVWAEENSTLTAGNYEWSFGNGAEVDQNDGVVIGVDCTLIAVGLSLNSGSATIIPVINGVDQTSATVAASGTNSDNLTTGLSIAVAAGDKINFKTTVSSSGDIGLASATFRVSAAPVSGVLNDIGDVSVGTPTQGTVLQFDNANNFWKSSDDPSGIGNVNVGFFKNNQITNQEVLRVQGPLSTGVNDGKGFSVGVDSETFSRSMFYTDGKFGMGPGSGNRDTFLHRESSGVFRISDDGGTGNGSLMINEDLFVFNKMQVGDQGSDSDFVDAALTVKDNADATDSDDPTDYHLYLWAPDNNDGDEVGIGFARTTTTNVIGAAITHLRDSSGSIGKLLFKTKETNVGGGPCVVGMSIDNVQHIGMGSGFEDPVTNLHIQESNTDTVPTIEIEQLSTGDSALQFSIPNDAYAMGIDNSDSDQFKISYASNEGDAVLGTNDRLRIDTDGKIEIVNSIVLNSGSPSQITSDQNNYDFGTESFVRLSTDASRTITGLLAGKDGQVLVICNIGSNDLSLANQNVSSTDVNRIITGSGGTVVISADQSVTLIYDGTTQRWRATVVPA